MSRLSKTALLILGIGIFVIACASLYLLYNRQAEEKRQLDASISLSQATLSKTTSQKEEQESSLAQLERELTQELNAKLDELNAKLDESNTKLAKSTTKHIEFKTELEQAELQLRGTQESWSTPVESIEYGEILFTIAHDWDLEITSLTASEPGSEDVKDVTYAATRFAVEVQGKSAESSIEDVIQLKAHIYETVDDVLGFINTIATGDDFTYATVKLVDMEVPELPTNEELDEMSDEKIEELLVTATIELEIYNYVGE